MDDLFHYMSRRKKEKNLRESTLMASKIQEKLKMILKKLLKMRVMKKMMHHLNPIPKLSPMTYYINILKLMKVRKKMILKWNMLIMKMKKNQLIY